MNKERQNQKWLYAVLALGVAALLLATDQILKYLVLRYLKPVGFIHVIDGLLELSYVENTGAAFGMLQNTRWLIVIIAAAAFVMMVVWLFRYKSHTLFSRTAACLILSGGLGNLIDRFLYGYVVDYIHVLFFPYVFNFADCCITVGAAVLVIHCLYVFHRDKQRQEELETAEQSTPPEDREA